MTLKSSSEAETRALGADLARRLSPGDVVLFEGELGAGKTTMIRGILEALGHPGPVRSPTFNLIQLFDTSPPVMHADLYRLKNAEGIGLEDYLGSHVCLIEWPDRLGGLVAQEDCWRVRIAFSNGGRAVEYIPPDISGRT